MKQKLLYYVVLGATALFNSSNSIAQDNFKIDNAKITSYSDYTHLPNFIKFNSNNRLVPENFSNWAKATFNLNAAVSFKSYNTETDKLGLTHIRFKQYVNQYPVDGTMLIAHVKDGNIVSVNGDFYALLNPNFSIRLSSKDALGKALLNVNAKKYKWENTAETEQMKKSFNDPNFSYLPKSELVVVHKEGKDYSAKSIRLAYKFDVYAEEPLSRDYIYIDTETGEMIAKKEILHTADVTATVSTVYSGSQTITFDNYASGQYRLRETGRGNGIKTFNIQNNSPSWAAPYPTSTYVDFTDNSTSWNLPSVDQAALDAHWGAEKTYDYYSNIHGRNSIDNNGFELQSFVHYDYNFANAFWNGICMTYGDGNGSSYTVMTGLDVCGHEITHGLNSFTADLGSGEAGALNEAWADILGTSMEFYARPSQSDWIMGADITSSGNGIRNMANPNILGDPDTYQGQYWSSSGEVHTNAGPAIYWYYLLCQGGSGTNDNGDSYSISGITMANAEKIAYRALVNYATPSTNYANMRVCTINAAEDLFGSCSPEVEATANAWYAVGVGPQYSSSVTASFAANTTSSCTVPVTINFNNTSNNVSNAVWDFGDGSTSTQFDPSHTYTNPGSYTVSLSVNGGCGTGSVTLVAYININPPVAPLTIGDTSCVPATVNLSASGGSTLKWYTVPSGGTSVHTGSNYTTPFLNSSTTYYVESTSPGPTGYFGPVDNTFSNSYNHISSSVRYMIFDVAQACQLISVDVFSSVAGNRTITLWDNANNVIQSWVKNIPNGASTVTFNVALTPGTGYRLGGSNMNLTYNAGGTSYPYSYTGLIDITGNNFNQSNYYYFYNWKIQEPACVSARTPVVATIGCVGINELSVLSSVSIYPNPSAGDVTLQVDALTDENAIIKVVNTIGQTVVTKQSKLNTGNNKVVLDMDNLAKGMYYIQLATPSETVTRKVQLN